MNSLLHVYNSLSGKKEVSSSSGNVKKDLIKFKKDLQNLRKFVEKNSINKKLLTRKISNKLQINLV